MNIEIHKYYSESGFWAVTARICFVFMAMMLLYASFAPKTRIPHIIYSYHLEHFALFYLFALSAGAAFVRRDVFHIGFLIWLGAILIEAIRWLRPEHKDFAIADWFADAAGVLAAMAPIGVGRFRDRFQRRP